MSMNYRVVPGIWRAGNQVFLRGDLVPEATLARLGPVSAWRRLGLIVPEGDPGPTEPTEPTPPPPWWDGLTKRELVDACEAREILIDPSMTKTQILDLVKEYS